MEGNTMPKVKPVPQGMHTVTPSLVFKDAVKAIEFYKRALGAEERSRHMSPDGRSVWHAELLIGDSVVFLGDEWPGMASAPTTERPSPVRLWLYVEDCDALYERAVKAGAKGSNPPVDMFWGDRCGMLRDPFGYEWTVATHVQDMTEEEMRRGGEEFAKQMAAPKKKTA